MTKEQFEEKLVVGTKIKIGRKYADEQGFELKFIDESEKNCNARVFEDDNKIVIVINEEDGDTILESLCIVFDKSTAIKFAKTLRTEINKITEGEENGSR